MHTETTARPGAGLTNREARRIAVARRFGVEVVNGATDEAINKLFAEICRETRAANAAQREAATAVPPAKRYLNGAQIARRYGVTPMTIFRWSKDPALGFPEPILIGARYYRSVDALDEWDRSRPRRKVA